MDWYKLFEIAAPSITTGGFIVIAAYLGYFKKKFEKYGEIEGQLEKLPKLSQIEEAIANAKNSNEFGYHRRKQDLENLLDFAILIVETSQDIQKDLNENEPSLNNLKKIDSTEKNKQSFENNKQKMMMIMLKYDIYFKHYDCKEFNENLDKWYKAAIQVIKLNNNSVLVHQIKNTSEPQNVINNFLINKANALEKARSSSSDLSKSYTMLAKTIKADKKITSHDSALFSNENCQL